MADFGHMGAECDACGQFFGGRDAAENININGECEECDDARLASQYDDDGDAAYQAVKDGYLTRG